jgi:hypothetical protein
MFSRIQQLCDDSAAGMNTHSKEKMISKQNDYLYAMLSNIGNKYLKLLFDHIKKRNEREPNYRSVTKLDLRYTRQV